MQLLIGHGADATTKTSTGANCLHVLASANPKFKKSSHRLERLLIKKITNLNEQDNNGNTPLHIAIFAQNNQLAARLVAHKADLNIQNRSGETALHEAAHSGNVAGIKLLLKHGANRTIQNSAGKTAINIVQEQPESKINPKTREQIKKLLL
jgi:ankyrin repeat protein